MGKFINLKGKRFGRLVVMERDFYCRQGQVKWKCKCDCGNIHYATTASLRSGKVRSCGCLFRDTHSTHGMTNTRLYKIWDGVKCRCNLPSHKHYDRYGGRGIAICDEWLDFNTFLKWAIMSEYNDTLTLDRIDNDGNYEPSNCRWITMTEQQSNKCNNKHLTYNGETKTIAEWVREFNLNRNTVDSRLRLGWNIPEEILFGKNVQHNGITA